MQNSLDSDQFQQLVGPDLDPNCLQRLSAGDIFYIIQYRRYAPDTIFIELRSMIMIKVIVTNK